VPPTNDDGLAAARAREHPDCWACSPGNPVGLGVAFEAGEDSSVHGTFVCDDDYVGYPGCLHGGVTSALLDAAMTNCLLGRGTPGLTARLAVRYLQPVPLGATVEVHGWWEGARGPLQKLAAELRLDGVVLAEATASFMTHTLASAPPAEGEDHEEGRHHHL
jgi:acyl-coenzyme A thioesterase PaaI-like protein